MTRLSSYIYYICTYVCACLVLLTGSKVELLHTKKCLNQPTEPNVLQCMYSTYRFTSGPSHWSHDDFKQHIAALATLTEHSKRCVVVLPYLRTCMYICACLVYRFTAHCCSGHSDRAHCRSGNSQRGVWWSISTYRFWRGDGRRSRRAGDKRTM